MWQTIECERRQRHSSHYMNEVSSGGRISSHLDVIPSQKIGTFQSYKISLLIPIMFFRRDSRNDEYERFGSICT